MKQYLLDTCTCIDVLQGNERVLEKLVTVKMKNCKISEMTIAELYYGASKSGREQHFKDVDDIRSYFKVIPVSSSLRTYGEVRAILEKQGSRLDDMDLLIGSTALHNGMTLVTHNMRHLTRIPGLEVQDWG